MRVLTTSEINEANAGKGFFFNLATGAVWGATFGAVLAIPAGPTKMLSGATTGAFNSIAMITAKESIENLISFFHDSYI